MATIEKSIEVHVPVDTAYNQWTQFEDFPRFMEGVEDVRQIDDTHLHWRARIGGKVEEWDAEISEQQPDRRVSWYSTSGAQNDGTVAFESIDPQTTRVDLVLEYQPQGMVEHVGDLVGIASRRVEGDLRRFKDFIEARRAETGAWRGQVQGGQSHSSIHPGGTFNQSGGLPPEGAGDLVDYPAGDPADLPGPEGVGDRVATTGGRAGVPPEGIGDQR